MGALCALNSPLLADSVDQNSFGLANSYVSLAPFTLVDKRRDDSVCDHSDDLHDPIEESS